MQRPLHKLSVFAVVLAAGLLTACSKAPSGPTPPPPPPPGPVLTCPADIAVQSISGGLVPVTFVPPTATTSRPPVTVACSRQAQSEYPVGTHPVTCTATDTIGQASCSFNVKVTLPERQLRFTKFMAYGDSVTEGYLAEPPAFNAMAKLLFTLPEATYPFRLEEMLRLRYASTDITVINEGVGGETAPQGEARIVTVVNRHKPEVVLLLHGYNEVHHIPIDDIRASIRAMARSAQVRGADVVLATLYQVSAYREGERPGSQAAIRALNSKIRRLASEISAGRIADLEAAFGNSAGLLGSDGLHPNVAGYQKIADTFLDVIVSRFESVPAAPAPPAPASLRRSGPAASSQFGRKSGH